MFLKNLQHFQHPYVLACYSTQSGVSSIHWLELQLQEVVPGDLLQTSLCSATCHNRPITSAVSLQQKHWWMFFIHIKSEILNGINYISFWWEYTVMISLYIMLQKYNRCPGILPTENYWYLICNLAHSCVFKIFWSQTCNYPVFTFIHNDHYAYGMSIMALRWPWQGCLP